MNIFIVVGIGFAFVVALIRAIAVDEIRGRIQNKARDSMEATIASLPPELRAEWADEWRAEFATLNSMPLSAVVFTRGLRQTAAKLVPSPELASASVGVGASGNAGPSVKAQLRRATSWLDRNGFPDFRRRRLLKISIAASLVVNGFALLARLLLGLNSTIVMPVGIVFAVIAMLPWALRR